MNSPAWCFQCSACGERFPLDKPRAMCDCGAVLDCKPPPGEFPSPPTSRTAGLDKYAGILPLPAGRRPLLQLGEGGTPLLEERFGDRRLFLKVESTQPTGSFKDRGYVLLVNHLSGWGVGEVVGDSSGNAACSLAAYCALAGIRATLYVPSRISTGKLRLLESFGAEVRRVPEGRSAARRLAVLEGRRTFYAGHVTHPLFLHGVKTIAYEIWAQMGKASPGTIVLPAGNGTLLLGLWLGFGELLRTGSIRSCPKLIAVQARSCAPLALAFQRGEEGPVRIDPEGTRAEGIAIPEPVRGKEILRAVRDSGGRMVTVGEEEIEAAHRQLSRKGFLVEPTSAAALAAATATAGPEEDPVVVILTGSGLKTLPAQ